MIVVFASVFAMVIPSQVYAADALTFDPTLNLSTGGNNAFLQVAASGSNVYAIWQSDISGLREIYFKKSTDNGATFGSTIKLSSTSSAAIDPYVAASGSNVYVVWADNTPGNFDIYFKRSTDNGATFGSKINRSNTAAMSDKPMVVASGNYVYVMWSEATSGTGHNEVYLVRSSDNGATFGSVINVSATTGYSRYPFMTVSGSNVYIAWSETKYDGSIVYYGDIYFKKSTDNGATFGSAIQLSNTQGRSGEPYGGQPRGEVKIVASGSNVYVTWGDAINYDDLYTDVFFSKSTDSGSTFSTAVNLSNNPTNSKTMQIAASGTNVHIVWSDNSVGEIFYRKSTDSGSSFSTAVNLSGNTGQSINPQIANVGTSDMQIVWTDASTASTYNDVLLRKSSDNGATFDSAINVSGTYYGSEDGRLAVSSGMVHVVWRETSSQEYIKYRVGS